MKPRSLTAAARLVEQSLLRAQSDERLVQLAAGGSEPAFEAIVARYRRPLVSYCARFVGDDGAEDAVQDTFVKALRALTHAEVVVNLHPWLYRIAHNTALNVLRDRGPEFAPLDELVDGAEDPYRVAEQRQELREVLAAVQMLPPRQRDAMVLRELEGRSYEEIAGELGVTDDAVRQLLNRARRSIRAGATAATPVGLLSRLPASIGDAPVTARVAELCGAGGTGAAAKVCATALMAGAVAGAVTTLPAKEAVTNGRAQAQAPSTAPASAPAQETIVRSHGAGSSPPTPAPTAAGDRARAGRLHSGGAAPRRAGCARRAASGRRRRRDPFGPCRPGACLDAFRRAIVGAAPRSLQPGRRADSVERAKRWRPTERRRPAARKLAHP